MKAVSLPLIVFLIVSASNAGHAQKSPNGQTPESQELKKALNAMVAQAGPPPKTKDRDQGDENASERAKEVVCTKDTPASRRSAICPTPISP